MSCAINPLQQTGVRILLAVALALIVVAIFVPWLVPHDPEIGILDQRFLPPSFEYWLGTDHLGRDVFSRLLFGVRTSLGTLSCVLALIVTIGTCAGCMAGFIGGWVDTVIMRICDVFMGFPTFILALFLVGMLGSGLTNIIIAIAMTHWAWYARLVRSFVLSLKNKEYLLASRISGSSPWHMLKRHILPLILVQIGIIASLDIGHMLLHVSALSFLGLGVSPPTPEWGIMLGDARQYLRNQPQLMLYPGLMIFFTVMLFNSLGDKLRDALDPSLRDQA